MDREEALALLDNQRKYFNDAFDRMQRNFDESSKLSEARVSDLVSSLEFTQAKFDEIKTKLDATDKENRNATSQIQLLTQENHLLRNRLSQTESRMDYLDDQGRRNNLRFAGVPEEPGENWEQCQRKITNILRDHLNIVPNFDRVHRVGKQSYQHPRDIVAKFSHFPDRDTAFRNRRKLRGTQIYINEDLCPASMEARRRQMDAFNEARKNGKFAYFNYRTLVIREFRPGGGGGGRSQREEGPSPSSPRTPPPPRTKPPTNQAFPALQSPIASQATRPLGSTTSSSSIREVTPSSLTGQLNIVQHYNSVGPLGAAEPPPRPGDTNHANQRNRKQTNFYKST